MVTKLDVFLELYKKGSPVKIVDIAKSLGQKKAGYEKTRKILEALRKEGKAAKNEYGYEQILNWENQHLYNMLIYCLRNGVNYNEIFSETLAKYLSKAMPRKEFAAKNVNIHPKTFSRISRILEKNGFLIVLSRKPFKASIPKSKFLSDIASYYGCNIKQTNNKARDHILEIKKELAKFNSLKQKNIRKYQNIIEQFQIKFIQHSLSIEGNPVTLAQTIKILKEKIMPENLSVEHAEEVRNYQKAFLQMLQNVQGETPLTKETMLNYHFIAMQHNPDIAGKIRDVPVIIKGNEDFKTASQEEIRELINKLTSKYKEFTQKKKHALKETLEFSAYLHNEFQYIHPFIDGNSRTARLILFHFLQQNNIPVFDVPLGLLESYVATTKGAKKRSDKKLSETLQQIILYNLKTINEKLDS